MAKTKTTKKLESMLEKKFDKRSDFYVFEYTYGWAGDEIVDCVMYNMERQVHCYELKQTVADFHSKAKLSFFGNKNYFVMPYGLYEKIKDEIPAEIGCYVMCTRTPVETVETNEYGVTRTCHSMKIEDGESELFCIKPAKKVELKCDKEILLSSMLRSISNETNLMVRDHYEHAQVSEKTWENRVSKAEHEVWMKRNEIFNLEHTLHNALKAQLGENASYEDKKELLKKYSHGALETLACLEFEEKIRKYAWKEVW